MKKIKMCYLYVKWSFEIIYDLVKHGVDGLNSKTIKSLEGIAKKEAERGDWKSYYKTNQHINNLKRFQMQSRGQRGE